LVPAMNTETGEWVIYHPPKSVSFGHQSRTRDPRRAWPIVEQFMAASTQFTLGNHIELICLWPETLVDSEAAMARIQEARQLFGAEVNSPGTHPRWIINESQIASAIQFALDNYNFPREQFGPARFYFSYQFLWNEFEWHSRKTTVSHARKRTSTLGVMIDNERLFLQPNFVFPAPWNSMLVRDSSIA
jgi:hypothetical protein